MKIVAISDTHGMHRSLDGKLPDGDVLIHAGDLTRHGSRDEFVDFCEWFGQQSHTHKIFIAGNHDAYAEKEAAQAKHYAEKFGLNYLIDSSIIIDGKHFYGSPRTPQFYNWSFMSARGEHIKRYWDNIPNDVDVLITHGPPLGQGDLVPPYPGMTQFPHSAGCLQLLLRIQEVKPKVHICGHIHAGYGISRCDELPMTTFVNAAICTEGYQPTNAPISFILK